MNLFYYYFFWVSPIILVLLYVYCRYKLNYWKRRGVQQLPDSNLIFGHFKNGFLFRTAPGYHLGEIYRKAASDAPFVGFYIFHKPCLLLKDPEIIKQVLIRDFDNFTNRHFAGFQQKDSIGMRNLFGLKGPAWRYLRTKITPMLSKGKFKQLLPLMMETAEPMMDYIKSTKVNEGGARIIDVQEMNFKFTADFISNSVLGTKTDAFKFPFSDCTKFFMNFFRGFKRKVALVIVFFMPELVNIFGSLVFFDTKPIRKIFWNSLETREKSGEKRGDFIDSIISLRNEEQSSLYKFEGDNLFNQIGQFFSGFESSSIASAFTLMELAKKKHYQDRAREDIKKAIDNHGWTLEAFNEMKYLDKCVTEGIRLHPAVSTIDRITHEDYKIPDTDIIIEKGTPIFISLFGLHEDPKYFDEPKEFKLERFDGNKKGSDANIPFGIGPRMCVGMKAGQLHVKIILSLILTNYEIYQKPEEKNELDPAATLTSAFKGINIEFKPIIQ